MDTFAFLTASTSETVLRLLSEHLEGVLDSAETCLSWCRRQHLQQRAAATSQEGEFAAAAAAEAEKDLLYCESEICHLLGRCAVIYIFFVLRSIKLCCQLSSRTVHTVKELSQTSFRLELLLGCSLKLSSRIYHTLGLLAKYFISRPADTVLLSKFDRLVPLVGSQTGLTKKTYELISHVEVRANFKERMPRCHRYTFSVLQEIFRDVIAIEAGGRGGGGKKSDAKTRQKYKRMKDIPTLVFRIETFEGHVLKLGNRCRVNLLEGTKVVIG